MNIQNKSILQMTAEEAMNFLMKSDNFVDFELPEYFNFNKILDEVRDTIGERDFDECLAEGQHPEDYAVNIDILMNKDGRYAVRPMVLANPYLYYFMVRELCNDEAWSTIMELFNKFAVLHLTSCAMPFMAGENKKNLKFHRAPIVFSWWKSVEQRSIELSLEYRYMFVTDITNCYGSITPQSIEWAFRLKGTQFEEKEGSTIAKNLLRYLSAMQQGRNIGIPQGSTLFDLIAEIVLGYADLLLHEAIEQKAKEFEMENKVFPNYEIIRYRDDYRIFCSDKNVLETISYILQHVLESLNFRMNSDKTKISSNVILDSIKPDKLDLIYNTPISRKIYDNEGKSHEICDFASFEKRLLYVLMFARQHPNAGQVKNLLSAIDRQVEKFVKKNTKDAFVFTWDDFAEPQEGEEKDDAPKGKKITWVRLPGGSAKAMAAICTQIALENVSCTHYALRLLSRIVDSLNEEETKNEILELVYKKLKGQPNSTYNEIWLQNITFKRDMEETPNGGEDRYDVELCHLVSGNKEAKLWCNDWLKPELQEGVGLTSIVSQEALSKITPVITFRERRAYDELDDLDIDDLFDDDDIPDFDEEDEKTLDCKDKKE